MLLYFVMMVFFLGRGDYSPNSTCTGHKFTQLSPISLSLSAFCDAGSGLGDGGLTSGYVWLNEEAVAAVCSSVISLYPV